MKKILILYTSVGLGHKYIAENIGFHLQHAGHEVVLHDILQVQEGAMVNIGVWLHSLINRRFPFIWRWLYFSKLVNSIGGPLRVPLAKSNSQNLEKIVNQFQPDVILSTQTTGSAATASLIEQKKFHGKFVIAFSDYHFHKFWVYPQANLYLVNIEEQKQEMLQLGIPEQNIVVCGITLKPQIQVQSAEIKAKLLIPSDHKVVIFGSGSLGIGFDFDLLVKYLQCLTEQNKQVTVLVMCGKNQKLKNQLDSLRMENIIPLGFYTNPTELYQMANVLVTKPGGLTIAEALQSNIPILITHTLPGQEEPNYDFLLKNNLVNAKPEPLSAQNLTAATQKLLTAQQENQGILANQIIQRGQEGKMLISAVNKLLNLP